VPTKLSNGAAMFVILTTVGLLGDVFVGILLQSRLKFCERYVNRILRKKVVA
jgi:hypothetical protein